MKCAMAGSSMRGLTPAPVKLGLCRWKPSPPMTFRIATSDDCLQLAELNQQLIQDEGHRNRMTAPELEQRMRDWLAGEYRAVIYEDGGEVIAYALYRERAEEIYLRQLFVVRHRRGQG